METTSHTLLRAVQVGPESPAWQRFVALYTPLLRRWALGRGFQPADAEDLVQEILLKLLGALPGYAPQTGIPFRSWLFRLTANAGHTFRQRVATRRLPESDGLSGVAADSPLEAMEEGEYRRELTRRALELIRPDFGEATMAAFTRLVVEGRTAAETAAELGLSENAVYLARHRVLTRLREELAGLLD